MRDDRGDDRGSRLGETMVRLRKEMMGGIR